MSAGLSLLAGPTWGDTGASLAARAIGNAGETITRKSEIDRKEAETEAKLQLAEARANAAGARAGEQAARTDIARDRLQLDRDRLGANTAKWNAQADLAERKFANQISRAEEKLRLSTNEDERRAAKLELDTLVAKARIETERIRSGQADTRSNLERERQELTRQGQAGMNQRNLLGARIQASNAYQNELKRIDAQNDQITKNNNLYGTKTPLLPRPTLNDYVRGNPLLRGLLPDDEDVTTPPPQPTTPAPTPQRATPQQGGGRTAAEQYLRANPTPEVRRFFDQRYGVGAAAAVLGN
jgi:hypothetical protein